MSVILKQIPFNTDEQTLSDLAYSDCVYAWLLVHSHYNPEEKHNYIYKEEFSLIQIARDVRKNRNTVSKRFNELLNKGIIRQNTYNRKTVYKIPHFSDFETLDGETVMELLLLPLKQETEELIKTYAYLLKKKRQAGYEGKTIFTTSSKECLEIFGHTATHAKLYSRMKLNFTILQGAGVIKFRTTNFRQNADGTVQPAMIEVYEVNDKASKEWIGVEKEIQ